MLRPETLESLYYLFWITREDVYREQAWAIFEAFEEHCRVDRGGYAGIEDVTDVGFDSRKMRQVLAHLSSVSCTYPLIRNQYTQYTSSSPDVDANCVTLYSV